MITLSGTVELLDKHGIDDGFIVGGIAEKGFSNNDIDIITYAGLPAPFHVSTDSEKPPGQAIDAKVTAVGKKEAGYIYTCEAGGGVIGKTYVTKIEAKVGDIIAVSVDHITKKDGGSFTWYGPKVTALRKDKSIPDTAAVLEKMAAGKGEEKEKEKKVDSIVFADSAGIQIDGSKLVDTKDGLLVKDAIICKAMVLDYQGKKILKSPEELALSMPTMQRMMITNEHPRARVIMDPSEIKGRILPETVRLDNDTAVGDMLITDKALADEVRDGKRDLSPGYYADVIEESGIFNDEPYEAVQKKVLYDHLAVVKKGRCARPVCGILDSINSNSEIELMERIPDTPDIPDMPKSALTDSIEKDLGKLHQVAAGLSEKNRELVGRFVESINNLLLTIHRMNWILNEVPEDKRDAMKLIVKSVTKSMAAMSDAVGDGATQSKPTNDSHSSSIDEDKKKETQDMTESIVVDGVGYTPEMVKKLVADSAALLEAQKKTTEESKSLLDAKEAKLVETDTALKASEVKIAALQAQIDAIEQERRAPLIKQIVDAMPVLKEEDLKTWDMKRLTDTAASIPEADKLRMKAGAKPSKSIVDDAYAKVGEK